jgi:prepilin peptidase CpaA
MLPGSLLIPSIILFVAMITDLRERKIYNKWILIALFLAVGSSYYFYSYDGIQQGALAAGIALLLTLPLVLIGALGAGDMKLLFAFGLATTYQTVFSIMLLSFVWAAILGIVLAVYKGRVGHLMMNTFRLATNPAERKELDLQKIPYTVPIFLAWLTFILLGLKQGALL